MKTPAMILALVALAGCAAGPRQQGDYWVPPPAQPMLPVQNNVQIGGGYQQQSGGVSAFWTGSSAQVQTVTGQIAMRCEYRYGGNVFYRLYPLGCPSNVQVQ